MGTFTDTFYEEVESLIESQIFLTICYAIFAVALFVYLYTGLLICQKRVGGNQEASGIAAQSKATGIAAQSRASGLAAQSKGAAFAECETVAENWLIATHAQHSPLNIVDTSSQCTLEQLIWENHDILPCAMLLKNTGKTAVLQAAYSCKKPSVQGASLPSPYTFVQLSFRWGSNCSYGADHMLNNQKFPLEMHALYRYGSEGKVLSSHDMLMVAFVFESGESNEYLEPITTNLKRIRKPGSKVKITTVPLSAIVPIFNGGFYCYIGSMIEPPYHEGVKWLVYSKPLTVSKAQLKEFRQLLGCDMQLIKQDRRPAHRTVE